jgi:hypothetical protein
MSGSCSTHTKFWLENLNGRENSEGLRRRWEYNIRMNHRVGDSGLD